MKPLTRRSTSARETNNKDSNNKRVQIKRVSNSSSNKSIKSSINSSGRKNMCKYINSNSNQCRNKIHGKTGYCTFHLRDYSSCCNSDKTNTGELCKLQKAKGKSRCFHHIKFHQNDPQELYLVDGIDESSNDKDAKDQQKENQLGANDNERTKDKDVVGIKNLNENGKSSENSNNKIDNNNNRSNDSGSKIEDNSLISNSSNSNLNQNNSCSSDSNSTHQTIAITDHAEKEMKTKNLNTAINNEKENLNDISSNGATLINQ